MGQFSKDWNNKRWKVFLGFKGELPTEGDLQSIKVLVFPGSARAVYDESNLFVSVVSAFIRKVMESYPSVKLFGSCFGHQIFGHALGGQTSQMQGIPSWRQKIIGREHIQLTDSFFTMPYVQKYMSDNSLTIDTFPSIVMQQSHGDHVSTLPASATLFGFSDSC